MFRIGVDGHVLTGKFQGTRTTLSNLLRSLAPKLGNRAKLVVYSDDPREAERLLDCPQIEYVDLGGVGSVRRLLHRFPRFFKRDHIDLGIFQYIAPLKGRHLVFIHDILPLTHPQFFPWKVRLRTLIYYTLSIRRAAKVVAVSKYTAEEITRRYNLPRERIAIVRNGPSFQPETYFEPREPAQEKYILTVGRIEPRKNVGLLAEAFQMADLEGVKLKIVGSFDPEFEKSQIMGSGVEIISGLDDGKLIELYRKASLFVYPSAAEGFGLPLLDAVLFGLPVISSDQTSLPEVGGKHATYFNPTTPDSTALLANLLRGHFTNRPLPHATPIERQEHAKNFSWDNSAERFVETLMQEQ